MRGPDGRLAFRSDCWLLSHIQFQQYFQLQLSTGKHCALIQLVKPTLVGHQRKLRKLER